MTTTPYKINIDGLLNSFTYEGPSPFHIISDDNKYAFIVGYMGDGYKFYFFGALVELENNTTINIFDLGQSEDTGGNWNIGFTDNGQSIKMGNSTYPVAATKNRLSFPLSMLFPEYA